MKFTLATAVALAISCVYALTINTPTNVVQCQPIQLTWDATGGVAPYFLSVHPGADPTGAALFEWDNLTGTSYTWNPVAVASGTSLSLLLRDSAGTSVQSAPFSVQSSTSSSCLNGTTPTSTTGTGTTPATTPASTPAGTTPGATSSGSTIPSSSHSSSSSSSKSGTATGTTGNGADYNAVRVGFAGAMAAVAAVILA